MHEAEEREPGGTPATPIVDETRLTGREWLLLLLLAGVQFANMVDFVIMMPLGPFLRDELGVSPRWFTLLVASYTFTACISALIASKFLDRFDRKLTLLVLFGGFAVGTFLCAIAPEYWSLLIARCVAGAFGGLVGSNVLTIVGDVFPDARRGLAMGVVMTAFSIAVIVGVPLGLVGVELFNWRFPFAMLAVLSGFVLALIWFVLPSFQGHMAAQGRMATNTWEMLTKPAHVRAYLLMCTLVTSSFLVVPLLPTYMEDNVGMLKTDLKYIYLVGGLFTLITSPLFGRISDLIGKLPVFYALAGLTALPILVLTNLPPVSVATALSVTTAFMVLTSGRFVPAMAMMTDCALPAERGSFMALTTSLQHLTVSVASVLGGLIVGETEDHRLTHYPLVGLVGAAMALLSVYIGSRLRPAVTPVANDSDAAQSPEKFEIVVGV